jgi:hypothetical protein
MSVNSEMRRHRGSKGGHNTLSPSDTKKAKRQRGKIARRLGQAQAREQVFQGVIVYQIAAGI